VILYHQRGTVLRSDDDGVTWAPVKGVPADKADQLIEHPFDKKTVPTQQILALSDIPGVHTHRGDNALSNFRPREELA